MLTPTEWLADICGNFAAPLWQKLDEMRAGRGKTLPDWPQWCFLPFAGWYALTTMLVGKPSLDKEEIPLMQALAVAGTWRVTQDIVRFDETLYQSLVDTPVTGNLPSSVLTRLPAWCVYVETPGMRVCNGEVQGVWAMLEHDVNGYGDELRLFLFAGDLALIPIVLQLGDWTIEEALSKPIYTDILRDLTDPDVGKAGVDTLQKISAIPQIVSLLLYLCTYGFPRQGMTPLEHPAYPKPKKVKTGWRLFPAQKPTVRIVGEDIGRKLREAEAQAPQTAEDREPGTHASPRPHIRRGHWHGFWHGPKDGERQLKLRWLPPIAVAMGESDGEE